MNLLHSDLSKQPNLLKSAPYVPFDQPIFADLLPIAVSIINLEGQYTYTNYSWRIINEMADNHITNIQWLQSVHPEDRSRVAFEWSNAVKKKNPFRSEYRLNRKDQQTSWVYLQVIPTDSLGFDQGNYFCSILDISRQKQLEARFRVSEARYRALTQHCSVGVWHIDPDGFTTFLNPSMCKMLQIESITLLKGKNYRCFFTSDSIHLMEREHAKRCLGVTSSYEVQLIGAHGRILDVMVTGAPLFGSDGSLKRLVATFLDISERKKIEFERSHFEQQLLETQKLESLGVLAGGIAHDFNNLLLAILGNAGLAAMELPPSSTAIDRIDRVRRVAERASELANQLLAYAGRGKFKTQIIDLSALVEDMGCLLETAISKTAKLKYEFTRELPGIEADPTQIRQIVMNLITNASDAIGMSTGDITIRTSMRTADPCDFMDQVDLECLPPRHLVVLEIEDSGCGMDSTTLDRAFDPFFTTKDSGRGLGLAAVVDIVKQHRGTVHVQSTPGSGSIFRIFFPGSDQTIEKLEPFKDLGLEKNTGQGRLLVVDDEAAVRDVAQSIFEKFGFDVISAEDGEQAMALFKQEYTSISAILLDMTMPKLSGEAAYQQIREVSPSIPIILSSGYGDKATLSSLLTDDKARFIQKPYRPLELISLVQQLLSQTPEED